MLPVDSSSIERIGYVGYDRELYIEFRNGRLYVYEASRRGSTWSCCKRDHAGATSTPRSSRTTPTVT